MSIQDAKATFELQAKELQEMAKKDDRFWVFICAVVMIEYLGKMIYGDKYQMARFIREYFNEGYRNFKYRNGNSDLPEQMFFILRGGVVHNFSFQPRKSEEKNGARFRSILIGHERNGDVHLSHNATHDAAIITAESFTKHIADVVQGIFNKANSDSFLKSTIEERIKKFPPIRSLS